MDVYVLLTNGIRYRIRLPLNTLGSIYDKISEDGYLLFRENDRDIVINASHIIAIGES